MRRPTKFFRCIFQQHDDAQYSACRPFLGGVSGTWYGDFVSGKLCLAAQRQLMALLLKILRFGTLKCAVTPIRAVLCCAVLCCIVVMQHGTVTRPAISFFSPASGGLKHLCVRQCFATLCCHAAQHLAIIFIFFASQWWLTEFRKWTSIRSRCAMRSVSVLQNAVM